MWLIVGQLPIKSRWWDVFLALRDFNRSNKHCHIKYNQKNIDMIKREPRICHSLESKWGPPDWLPMVTATMLSSTATEKSYNTLYTHP